MPPTQKSKRAANDSEVPVQRSKRSKYSSIACDICRSRKLECERDPSNHACDRCMRNGTVCVMTRPRRFAVPIPPMATDDNDASARFKRIEDELRLLRAQVAQLTSQRAGRKHDRAPFPPASGILAMAEPHFVGTTRPAFSLKIAKESLAELDDPGPEDAPLEDAPSHGETEQANSEQRSPPRASTTQPEDGHEDKSEDESDRTDPLLQIPLPEAHQLLASYRDNIDAVYPVLHSVDLESRIPDVYERVKAGRLDGGPEQKEAQLLRAVLATSLVMKGDKEAKMLSQDLMNTVEGEVSRMRAHVRIDLPGIRLITIMVSSENIIQAINHFYSEEELCAWRLIGLAGRFVLEMGLHRRQSLLENFADPERQMSALCLFWCVYVLDRGFSFGVGLSFNLNDHDIDPDLPELACTSIPYPIHSSQLTSSHHQPTSMPYLRSLLAYGRLSSLVWDALPQFDAPTDATPSHSTTTIDRSVQSWHSSLPSSLRLPSSPTSLPARDRNIRTLHHLRHNHLRALLNRHHILSPAAIAARPHHSRLVVDLAVDSMSVIAALSRETELYDRTGAAYSHFLVGALASVLLAVGHAPGVFGFACGQGTGFAEAVELVRGSRGESVAARRMWAGMCGLVAGVRRRLGAGVGDAVGGEKGDKVVVAQGGGSREEQGWEERGVVGCRNGSQTGAATNVSQQFDRRGLGNIDPSLRDQGGALGMYSNTPGLEGMAHADADLIGLLDTLSWGYLDGDEQPFGKGIPLGDMSESDPSSLFMEERGEVDLISRYYMGYI
ncbi:hypothetical protein C8A05DRAFT_13250 [Staphylotrichum tortipilum]|uniref:Zn(2)-C6 fungal-type domain-containing protein n=1 Tax=Staphylotrichum tortipilum TaxID=2831512 RepID=A0AAN6RVU5_9PEZI|nr:hypothetical protein C8A05DRAFT_13250 [Staphylotrichum longicolle]